MDAFSIYKRCPAAICVGLFISVLFSLGCSKQDDWLDQKRSGTDVVPQSLKDVQAVLDNTFVMNSGYASIGLIGTDNMYITDADLNTLYHAERNAYLWEKEIFLGDVSVEWWYAYQMAAYSNISLEALDKISPSAGDRQMYSNLKGSALFYRSMAFFELAQLFCKPFDETSSASDAGIPVRLSSDVNMSVSRGTVKETYDRILTDLQQAAGLLPDVPLYTTRPSSVAAKALLAKVFLSMRDYSKAYLYADSVLQVRNELLDFNSSLVSPSLPYSFPVFGAGNPEIIFHAIAANYVSIASYTSGLARVHPVLYSSYSQDDLRKTVFYRDYGNGRVRFQGNYTGTGDNFAGIAVNEILLIRAECLARQGRTTEAMDDINCLLRYRFRAGSVYELHAEDAGQALELVLTERRKELSFTGQIRWEDLRRLNAEGRFSKTLERTYNASGPVLPPNDKRYVFPLPELDVSLYNLPQNER